MNRLFRSVTAAVAALTLSAGGVSALAESSDSASGALPVSIAQEDWAASKKFVTLSTGITMAYVEMGDPDGEVVVLQHGMTDNSRSWSLAAPYFAAAGYHVYLPDLRGMGLTDKPEGYYTLITYATDLKAFFDSMGIEKAVVVGHSLGSFTMQAFCLMFPERCSRLVLVSSLPVRGLQDEKLDAAWHAFIEPLDEDGHPSDAFMDKWYACEPKEDGVRDVFDTFLANMKKEAQALPKYAWTAIFRGLMATTLEKLYQDLDTDIPVLILHGDEDTMTPTGYQEELCGLFHVDENSYRNYEGIGHNVQFEIPERCATDILTWLATGSLPE